MSGCATAWIAGFTSKTMLEIPITEGEFNAKREWCWVPIPENQYPESVSIPGYWRIPAGDGLVNGSV